MEKLRWWHVAVVSVAVVLTPVILTFDLEPWQRLGALASLAAFVVAWFTIGRLAWRSETAAIFFTIAVIVTTGAAVSFLPVMAVMQCAAYPLVWIVSRNVREAIVANVLLATAVGVGFVISTGDLAQAGMTMALSLGFSLALGLWITQIWATSDQRQGLLDELRAAQDQLATLNRDAGVTSERERLAREIHDTIAQDLTAMVLLAQRSRRDLDAGDTAGAGRQLALLEDGARSALAETRALVAASAPIGLASGGIAEALGRLAERLSKETSVEVGVDIGELPPLERDAEVVLLRCAQEGLANVRKHAQASRATLALASDEASVTLRVSDNGAGFNPAAPADGFGLNGMRDRLALVGGTLEVSSSGSGTELTVTLPVTA